MYPFDSRWRWLLAGRHSHLLAALAMSPTGDSFVVERIAQLRKYNTAHLVVGGLLFFGLVGSGLTYVASLLPALGGIWAVARDAAALVGALTGVLTLAYLFIARLLSQVEADLLMLLILRQKRASREQMA